MNLTFKGFLRGYCRELTGLQTDSLKKLFAAVLADAPAAAEAVMCFAAAQDKAGYLADISRNTAWEDSYRAIASSLAGFTNFEEFLASDSAPDRYSKVWRAYCSKKNAASADRRVIALMRVKTLEAMERTQRTTYGLCKQLGLNRGNVYAYLNAGDVTKVSRATARRLMEAAGA